MHKVVITDFINDDLATEREALAGLIDISRLARLLKRVKGKIRPVRLSGVSPFAAPLLMEIGKEPVFGLASEAILADKASDLIEEAMDLSMLPKELAG